MPSKPTNNHRLTPRQLQLLKAIAAFQGRHCYSPTIAELAVELNISRSTAFEHITELRKKGLLSAQPARARSLKLTSKAQKLLNTLTGGDQADPNSSPAGIRLAGKVAAGAPIEAIEQKDNLSLASHFGTNGDTFALEVTGDSMIGDDICDGDYVICRRTPTARNGQLVIAITDNENATLKRFYKEKTAVRLQPSNDAYDPIYSKNCRVEAVVVGLVRKL